MPDKTIKWFPEIESHPLLIVLANLSESEGGKALMQLLDGTAGYFTANVMEDPTPKPYFAGYGQALIDLGLVLGGARDKLRELQNM
jgi:hypothetical protein